MNGPNPPKRFIVAFVVLVVFLGANAVISQRSIRTLIEDQRQVSHTNEALARLDEIFATLTEAESGQRGYLLTGDEVYLSYYNDDLKLLPQQLDTIQRLTADNFLQRQRLELLKGQVNARVRALEDVVNVARTKGPAAASQEIEVNRGRQLMLQVRSTINEMKSEEERLLEIRARESRQSARRTQLTFAAASLLAILLAAVAYLLLRRYLILEYAATEELRRKQADLRVSYQRMELAQQAADFSVFEWNIRENTIFWFGNTENLYGLSPSQLSTYQIWMRTLHPEDREGVEEELQELRRSGAPFVREFRVIWPNGTEHWIAGRGRLFQEGERPGRVIGINLNITARKQAESALQSSERLAATGRLAATIAHEINNPLEAVNNVLFLLTSSDGLDENSRRLTQMAQEELKRIMHIVRQTLGFYREAANPIWLRISELMETVVELYHRRIQQKRLTVTTDFAEEISIEAFPGEMRQVFSNLIANAIDALPIGGRIVVRVREVHNPAELSQSGILCSVSDNGEGITRSNRKSIFEPFFTTKGEKGTGLGLWVTHGIVQKHGGWIRVHSRTEPGCSGTTFLVFLPKDYSGLREADGLNSMSA